MEEEPMCFAELDGNALTFTLPSGWKGTVEVSFTGSNKKLVGFQKGLESTTFNFCTDPNPGPLTIENATGVPVECVATVLYDTTVCAGGLPTIPADNSSEVKCESLGTKNEGQWSFNCPDSTNTAVISIVIEEDTQGD